MSANDKMPNEPMLVHGIHIFYRGEAHFMGPSIKQCMGVIHDFIWANDVFYTDTDPLYIFADHHLVYYLMKVDQIKYTDAEGVEHERRAVVMLDFQGNIKETFALTR